MRKEGLENLILTGYTEIKKKLQINYLTSSNERVPRQEQKEERQ